jgi:hypothetical protein
MGNFRHFVIIFSPSFQIIVLESYNSFHHKMDKVSGIGIKRAFSLQKESIHVFFNKKWSVSMSMSNDQGSFCGHPNFNFALKKGSTFCCKTFRFESKN